MVSAVHGAQVQQAPCTVVVSVVKSVGPPIPWPPSSAIGKFIPPAMVVGVSNLPPDALVASDRGQPVHILSVETDSGPRRIAMVAGGLRLQTTMGQPMSQAVPVAIESILSKARPQDSFALSIAGDPPLTLPFGSSRDAIQAAVEQLRRPNRGKGGGRAVLDALLGAAAWFGSPLMGDTIVLFGGLPHESRGRLSKLRGALANGRIRLLVFTGTAMTTVGGNGFLIGDWVSPLAWLCSWSGGGYEFVGYGGAKATDENRWLWQNEGESLYGRTTTIYILQLERTGPGVAVYLSPQFRDQMPHAAVTYPWPLPVCPPAGVGGPVSGQASN